MLSRFRWPWRTTPASFTGCTFPKRKEELGQLEQLDALLKESQPLLSRRPRTLKLVEYLGRWSRLPRTRLKAATSWHRNLRTLSTPPECSRQHSGNQELQA